MTLQAFPAFRPATDAEILAAKAVDIRLGWQVRFRHFVLETGHHRSATGVMHRQHSRSKLRVIDGAPFVMHHGKLQRVTATVAEQEGFKSAVFDLRIASEYLP